MKLEAVDYTAKDADKQFVESLRATGFGVLKNHPISKTSVTSIYQNWQGFFDSSDKEQYLFDRETQDGFFPTTVSETAKGFKKKDIRRPPTDGEGFVNSCFPNTSDCSGVR